MTLPEHSRFQLTPDLSICRLLNGMWQVSGAHGRIDPAAAVDNMLAYHHDGLTTWDLADHYGPAEDLIGEFRRRLAADQGPGALAGSQAFTKWVPRPGPMPRRVVEQAVDISRRRMGTDMLDMLQFHWWDYRHPAYIDALQHLSDLRDEGKLRHVALTNFDTARMDLIQQAGIRVVSNQVQYSIIDRRPEVKMVEFCLEHNISLLTYGTLCGGLLTDRYLGKPEPGAGALNTASLRKYKGMIDAWGGWGLYQELLAALDGIARRHDVTIANVAVNYILDKPAVAGVIAGARLGLSDNRRENVRAFDFMLDDSDRDAIQSVTGRARDLYRIIGDCGDEYRR